MSEEPITTYNWIVTLNNPTETTGMYDTQYTSNEISQVIVKALNEEDAMKCAIQYLHTLRPRYLNESQQITNWSVLLCDESRQYSVFKCDIEVETPKELCYSNLNLYD